MKIKSNKDENSLLRLKENEHQLQKLNIQLEELKQKILLVKQKQQIHNHHSNNSQNGVESEIRNRRFSTSKENEQNILGINEENYNFFVKKSFSHKEFQEYEKILKKKFEEELNDTMKNYHNKLKNKLYLQQNSMLLKLQQQQNERNNITEKKIQFDDANRLIKKSQIHFRKTLEPPDQINSSKNYFLSSNFQKTHQPIKTFHIKHRNSPRIPFPSTSKNKYPSFNQIQHQHKIRHRSNNHSNAWNPSNNLFSTTKVPIFKLNSKLSDKPKIKEEVITTTFIRNKNSKTKPSSKNFPGNYGNPHNYQKKSSDKTQITLPTTTTTTTTTTNKIKYFKTKFIPESKHSQSINSIKNQELIKKQKEKEQQEQQKEKKKKKKKQQQQHIFQLNQQNDSSFDKNFIKDTDEDITTDYEEFFQKNNKEINEKNIKLLTLNEENTSLNNTNLKITSNNFPDVIIKDSGEANSNNINFFNKKKLIKNKNFKQDLITKNSITYSTSLSSSKSETIFNTKGRLKKKINKQEKKINFEKKLQEFFSASFSKSSPAISSRNSSFLATNNITESYTNEDSFEKNNNCIIDYWDVDYNETQEDEQIKEIINNNNGIIDNIIEIKNNNEELELDSQSSLNVPSSHSQTPSPFNFFSNSPIEQKLKQRNMKKFKKINDENYI